MEERSTQLASNDYADLNAFWQTVENALHRHLTHFLTQVGDKANGLASPDVRKMLTDVERKWDDRGQEGLHLAGSPITAATFHTIKISLNRYHHAQTTHWDIFEQGFSAAISLLDAFQTYAGMQTTQTVEELRKKWESIERTGNSAYDFNQKIEVQEAQDNGHRLASRVLLKNLPVDATTNAVMCALKAQDIDVEEESIHLEQGVIELSEEDQKSLLELGSVIIKRVPVSFEKQADGVEVMLYLPKPLDLDLIAGMWENTFGHVAEMTFESGSRDQIVVVRLTKQQYKEAEGKEIILLRKKIKILCRTGHRVKLLVPGTLSEDTIRKILLQLVAEKELIGLALLQDQGCAYVHLANEQAKSKLLEKKYLEVKSSLPALKKVETVSTSAPPNSTPASPKKAEAAKQTKTKKQKSSGQPDETKAAVISPVPKSVDLNTLYTILKEKGIEGGFITLRDGKAYIELIPNQYNKILALKGIQSNGASMTISPFNGEIPAWTIGLRPSPANIPKGNISQAIIQAFVKMDAGKIGRITISSDSIHVPVSTEACYTKILQMEHLDILGKKLSVFDPNSHLKVVQLEDQTQMFFLNKMRKKLDALELKHSAKITLKMYPSVQPNNVHIVGTTGAPMSPQKKNGVGAKKSHKSGDKGTASAANTIATDKKTPNPSKNDSQKKIKNEKIPKKDSQKKDLEQKVANPQNNSNAKSQNIKKSAEQTKLVPVVKIQAKVQENAEKAWNDIESLLKGAHRKQVVLNFKENETVLLAITETKLKELGQESKEATIFVKRKGLSLMVQVMGEDSQTVKTLSEKPNHIRTKLCVDRSKNISTQVASQLNLVKLANGFNVKIEHNKKTGQLSVFGSSESVKACVEHIGANDLHKLTVAGAKALYFSEHLKPALQNSLPRVQTKQLKNGFALSGPKEDIDRMASLLGQLAETPVIRINPRLRNLATAFIGKLIKEHGVSGSLFFEEKQESAPQHSAQKSTEEEQERESKGNNNDSLLVVFVHFANLPPQLKMKLDAMKLYQVSMRYTGEETSAVGKLNLAAATDALLVEVNPNDQVITFSSFIPDEAQKACALVRDLFDKETQNHKPHVYIAPLAVEAALLANLHTLEQSYGIVIELSKMEDKLLVGVYGPTKGKIAVGQVLRLMEQQ